MIDETLPKEIGEDDRILFYFAGHGLAMDGEDGPEGYLIPQNAKSGDRKTFLPMRNLHNALIKLTCRHALIILDCCFSGAFRWSSVRDIGGALPVIYQERYDRFIQDPAWQVITSAAYDQAASDIPLEMSRRVGLSGDHSPFAKALLVPDHELNLPPAPTLNTQNNPYRGLESFDPEHADLFFGRTQLIEELKNFVNQHPLTLVLGASGTGKSSLVKAGLIPCLQDALEAKWEILPVLRPGESPIQALAAGILPLFERQALSLGHLSLALAEDGVTSDDTPINKLIKVFQKSSYAYLVFLSVSIFERAVELGLWPTIDELLEEAGLG